MAPKTPYAALIALSIAIGPTAFGQARAVDDAALKNAGRSGGEWLTYGLTPGETRYSTLNQINTSNVSRLGLAWSYDVGRGGVQLPVFSLMRLRIRISTVRSKITLTT